MDQLATLFEQLSREPDFDAPELQAHDASDRLLLETAASLITEMSPQPRLDEIVIIGDRHGALTLGSQAPLDASRFEIEPLDTGRGRLRVHQDPLLGERALAANAARIFPETPAAQLFTHHSLDESLLSGARLVLLQLPKSLAELDEIAQAVARWAAPDVILLAGGRVKYMTHAMNGVLARSFGDVSAGLAARKSRVLQASAPRTVLDLGAPRFPVWERDAALPFDTAAFGATFGGAKLDHGSRLLLSGLTRDGWPEAKRIVDLGCGNGVLAVSAALACPSAEVIATDQSAAAVAATRLTADAAGVGERVQIHRVDGTEVTPSGWADLILLNPPFHAGTTVHTGVAHRLIRDCARALAPGGELRLVFNSSLGYRSLVERVIGPCRQISRDRSFTVLSATRH